VHGLHYESRSAQYPEQRLNVQSSGHEPRPGSIVLPRTYTYKRGASERCVQQPKLSLRRGTGKEIGIGQSRSRTARALQPGNFMPDKQAAECHALTHLVILCGWPLLILILPRCCLS
jgi:hypothetical protein